MIKERRLDFTYVGEQLIKIALLLVVIFALIALCNDAILMSSLDTAELPNLHFERVSLEDQFTRDMEAIEVPEYLLPPEPEVIYISEEDVWLLAQLMYAEEGIYYYKYDDKTAERVHKLAGSVVLHRAEVEYRGATTIEEVIFSRGQYHQQTLQRVCDGQDIPEEIYEWAKDLLIDGPIGPRGMIYQSEFEQGVLYDEIGNQKFGVEPKYNN